jgi:hypothetical protein
MAAREKVTIMIAIFRTEINESQLLIGEGFTLIEAVVRAIEFNFDDQVVMNAVQNYGPNDFEGLYEWYLSRGIYLSEPLVVSDENK